MNVDKDVLVFSNENLDHTPVHEMEPWVILIVDDDEEIHRATSYAFKRFSYTNRPASFLNAYSAQEAREILKTHKNIACIFLDVVMETQDAGLVLASYIRDELGNHEVRIILRTGQPGYAPKVEVIQDYDINDYKEKAELTRDSLFTCLTTALRSYQQIQTIESSRKGLEMVIEASSSLLQESKAVTQFSAGILTQICGLLHVKPEGVVCIHNSHEEHLPPTILAAAGAYTDSVGSPLTCLNKPDISQSVEEVFNRRKSQYLENISYIYIPLSSMGEIVVFINSPLSIDNLEHQLLELFCINISVGFENTKMFEKVEHLAYHNQLTKLPNKLALLEKIEEALLIKQHHFGVFLVDVNNFEEVNDGLGYNIGDKLINQVGSILASHSNKVQFIAHLGGDVFGLVIPIREREMSHQLLEEIESWFTASFIIEDNVIPISISIGCSYFDGSEENADSLLRSAGIALKHAKENRNGKTCLFESGMNTALQERLNIIKDIHHAVENEEFCLFYQPQICLSTGRIVGLESLIRWRHPDGHLVSPAQFIPAAESSGLIVEIGQWVLKTAINQHLAFEKEGYKGIRIAVNVSPRQLCEPDYVEQVKQAISDSGMDTKYLELEITETMAMTDSSKQIDKLASLREQGVQIAIDDFGTGYSSLNYLQQLPIDRLKIDGSFVRHIDTRKEDASIAAMIISMGHELNLSVIAECIETTEHQKILSHLGCDEAQGYLYAKPLPADELSELLSSLYDSQKQEISFDI